MTAFDIEAEAISSVVDIDRMSVMYDTGIRPEHFIDPVNASIFDFSLKYYQSSGFSACPSEEVLKSEFPAVEIKDSLESVSWICSEIKSRYLSGNVQELLIDVSKYVQEKPLTALKDLQDRAWRLSSSTQDRTSTSNLKSNVEARKRRLQERQEAANNNEILGVRIGFEEIDKFTGGLRPGELASVAGFAKAGKTWIGLQIAKTAAVIGQKCLFITLELSIEEVEDRLDAMLSGVSYARMQSGTLSKKERAILIESYDNMSSIGDVIIEQPEIGKRSAQMIIKRARELNVDVVVIDQMSFMESASGDTNTELKAYRNVVSDLKREISRRDEKQLPCFLLAQMNRESMSRRHGRGDMSTLASTSELERASDIVYGISKSRQEAINNVSTLEILGARRVDIKSWVIKTQLRDSTTFEVIRERDSDDE